MNVFSCHRVEFDDLASFLLELFFMTRPIRYMPKPDTLFEITNRTMQGRLLLKPSKTLKDILLGVMGRAVEIHPEIKLYAFVFASNHFHLLLSSPDYKSIAMFMNHINSNIAREAGRLYHWREKFWSRRYRAIPVLDDASALGRLKYFLAHGCKENLVDSPKKWPGLSCLESLLYGKKLEGHWFDRTALYHAQRKKKSEELDLSKFKILQEVNLTPLPAWEKLSVEQRRAQVGQMVADIEKDLKERLAQTGESLLGVESVLTKRPDGLPLKSKRSPAPFCHAFTRARRLKYKELYQRFVSAFRLASDRLRAGLASSTREFPEHCFPPPWAYNGPG
jgi:hypothetical protein